MRQGQQNKRMRGRNRGGGGGKGPNPLTRSYESNGPDVKIRGTALHIAEKYVQLARDAQSSGDRVAAESYLQHAEHYYRLVAAAQAQMPQPQPIFRSDEEGDEDDERMPGANGYGDRQQFRQNPQAYGGDREPPPPAHGDHAAQPPPAAARGDAQPAVHAEEGAAPQGGNGGDRPPREEGRGFRSRRRRPYRDRFAGEGGEGQPSPQGASEPAGEAAGGED